jgi:hypothetical protein
VIASPNNNPIFATIEQVQQMINNSSLHQKAFKVFDNNGNELGISFSGTEVIYIESQDRFVNIHNNAIFPHYNLYFGSSDCTGQPLMPTSVLTQAGLSDVVGGQINQFFTFNRSLQMVLTRKSVEGKLERVDLTQEGKDHAKATTNLYARI